MDPVAPKPLFGHPCNGCGLCCIKEVCAVGKLAGLNETPCPALTLSPEGYRCGFVLVEVESKLKPLIQRRLGIGVGCTMHDASTSGADVDKLQDRWAKLYSD